MKAAFVAQRRSGVQSEVAYFHDSAGHRQGKFSFINYSLITVYNYRDA